MKISVLGTGNMGSALAKALKRTQHNIFLRGATEGSISCQNLCRTLSLKEAKSNDLMDSDIIFLAIPSKAITSATEQLQGFSGIIISVIGFDNYLNTENGNPRSASETVSDLIPTASVVHGYTWMSSGMVEHPSKQVATSVVHCSDDRTALLKVCELTKEMGFQPIRAGRLFNARFAEAAGFLWGAIAIEESYGWNTFFEVHPENNI